MEELINLSDSATKRIYEIKSKAENRDKFLRISVSGGGCSGFQYNFSLDNQINDDDKTIKKDGDILLAIDQTSLNFVGNSKIDFVADLSGYSFKIDNPNAKASCGCGSSFNI